MDYLSPHTCITTPMPLPKFCCGRNEVCTPLPLHPYHFIATLEWHCNVILHVCDALQCHFSAILRCHSNTTPKVYSYTTPKCTLHRDSATTIHATLTGHSNGTLGYLWGVNLPICDAPLSEWHYSVHSGLWKYSTPSTLYCHSVRVGGLTHYIDYALSLPSYKLTTSHSVAKPSLI